MLNEFLVNNTFQVVNEFSHKRDIEELLASNPFLVVQDDGENFKGILSAINLTTKPDGTEGYSVSYRPRIQIKDNIAEVLNKINSSVYNELPVFKKNNFIGVVCEEKISNYLEITHDKKNKLEKTAIELYKSEMNLDIFLNNRDESIWSIDTNFNFVIFNNYFENNYLGAFAIRIKRGMNALDILTPELVKFWKPKYEQALSGNKVNFEFTLKINDCNACYVNFLNPIVINGEITGVSCLSIDISEKKENETKLKELNLVRDKLFLIIAHDLRSPFNSILGFTSIIDDCLQDLSAVEIKKYLNHIHNSGKNALDIIDRLLDWGKTQSNLLDNTLEIINTATLIPEVIKPFYSLAKEKNVSLIYTCLSNAELNTDKEMLKTVLRNLISNAVKFTKTDGRIIIKTISIQDAVQITVSDNGIGINEEKRSKIFSTLNSSKGTHNERGLGIGLFLCKQIVEKLGGVISFESDEKKGTNFIFTIPLETSSKRNLQQITDLKEA